MACRTCQQTLAAACNTASVSGLHLDTAGLQSWQCLPSCCTRWLCQQGDTLWCLPESSDFDQQSDGVPLRGSQQGVGGNGSVLGAARALQQYRFYVLTLLKAIAGTIFSCQALCHLV